MSMQEKEFQYEEELRNEDKKIATYFKILPKYMDLPSENLGIIDELNYELERDKKRLIQAKKSVELPQEFIKISLNLEDDNSFEEFADEQNFDGVVTILLAKVEYGYLIEKFKQLSMRYIMLFSKEERINPHRKYMQIITVINKVISKFQDLLILNEDDISLKKCLCKRILKEIHLLIRLMSDVEKIVDKNGYNVQLDIDTVKIARSSLLDILLGK